MTRKQYKGFLSLLQWVSVIAEYETLREAQRLVASRLAAAETALEEAFTKEYHEKARWRQ